MEERNLQNLGSAATMGLGAESAPSGEPIGLHPGTVVGGKFRIERVIAEGGMGLVVAATHLDLDQLVALKFFRAEVGSDRRSLLERFTREAKAAARLKSEHVARVFDVSVTDDGRPYMVIEYLEGQSLDRLLEDNGPLDVARAVEYGAQACEGLAEAHARGIVHRDIKPSNLFLVSRAPGPGIIKILDFGISKLALSDASNFATNIMMGTPCYMSPEQIRSTATVDHRADIWSLGATLYQLLAGKAPFDASRDLLALAESIVFDSPQPLDQLRPDVPKELAAVVERCLSKDRNARFASTGEMALALLPFASPRASSAVERAASMSPAMPRVADVGPLPEVPRGFHPRTVRSARGKGTGTGAGKGTGMGTGTWKGGVPGAAPRGVFIAGAVAAVVFVATWSISTVLSSRATVTTTTATAVPAAAPAAAKPTSSETAGATPTAAPSSSAAAPGAIVVSPITASGETALLVRASPPAAQISVDGVLVAGNPFRGRYPKNGVHEIVALARGYTTMKKRVSLDEDLVVDLTLARQQNSSQNGSEVSNGGGGRSRARAELASMRSAAAPSEIAASSSLGRRQEVDPAGGHEPLRPIEVRNPYGTQ